MKVRRHHNNKGFRQIKNGGTRKWVRRLCRRLSGSLKPSRVIVDPERGYGQPIVEPECVPVSALVGMYKAGETIYDVADAFEVRVDSVRAAIKYHEMGKSCEA